MRKILVVDNHPMMVKYLNTLLEGEGYELRSANDGLTALDMIRQEKPDCIFVDLVMPHIDGRTLCKIIRNIPDFSDIRIIVLSAIAAEANGAHPIEADIIIAKGPFKQLGPIILESLSKLDDLKDGPILGLEAVYPREITRELLNMNKYLNLVLERMSEAILELTKEGRIVYVNSAAYRLFERSVDEIMGQFLADLIPDMYRLAIEEALHQDHGSDFSEAGFPWQIGERYLFTQVFPLEAEPSSKYMVIFTDVTDRIVREQQLRESEKFRAIGTLAAGVAHDFNNLLMNFQGNLDILLRDINDSHPYYNRFKAMEKHIGHGKRMTGQLLGYARKGRYQMKKVSLNEIISDVIYSFESSRGVCVIQELDPRLPELTADPTQLTQVILNLLINAADAIDPQGSISIQTDLVDSKDIVGTNFTAIEGPYVAMHVADNGSGIDPQVLPKIFDPFFTTKEVGRGTGLGLASVYGIVKGHQGYVTVESELQIGTQFHIYFPARAEIAVEHTASHRLSGKVLLIDDSEDFRNVGRDMLHALGFKVDTAANGIEGLELFREYPRQYDFILLDMIMPKLGGREVFLEAQKIFPDVRVIFASGYSFNEDVGELVDNKRRVLLSKPFKMSDLAEVSKRILEAP